MYTCKALVFKHTISHLIAETHLPNVYWWMVLQIPLGFPDNKVVEKELRDVCKLKLNYSVLLLQS